MLATPTKKPLRAIPTGRCRIKVAIRQDLYLDSVNGMLQQFGELAGFTPCMTHIILDPLYDPEEVLSYINSFADSDCEHFKKAG